jgi:uncharacterized tellurite resistance protein B-like protein
MDILSASPTQKLAALRALKTVALADGTFDARELAMVRAVAETLGVDGRPEDLEPITAAELASAITEPELRLRLVQALLVMALADTEGSRAEADLVDEIAEALDVDSHWVRDLRLLAKGHIMRLRLDVMRHSFIPGMLKDALKRRGIKGVLEFFGPQLGMGLDAERAWRFKRLGLLPEGTLGRGFWAHMTKNGFAFPGEPEGMPEQVAPHDMVHVLAGYDTDPIGELQVGAFTAGMCRHDNAFVADPFFFLFSGMLLFHADVAIRPRFGSSKDLWRPKPILEALQRGAATKRNLVDGWDFWADVERPLAELREELGIPATS